MKIKTVHRKDGTNYSLFCVQQRSDKRYQSSDKSARRIKRKYYENHENTSCFVYTELEVSVDILPFFYKLALLLLFRLATLILMMIQIQALAD